MATETTTAGWNEPAQLNSDPTVALMARVKDAQQAFLKSDADRQKVFGAAYESGALTLGQIVEAMGLTSSRVRSLVQAAGAGAEDRQKAAAQAALAALGE